MHLPFVKIILSTCSKYIFRKLIKNLFYIPSTIGVAQTHTAEANIIKAINLIVEAMLRMIKTRTTNYETGFCVTEVRQLSASVINEVLIKPPRLLYFTNEGEAQTHAFRLLTGEDTT